MNVDISGFGKSVKIDVKDAEATKAGAIGRDKQRLFVMMMGSLVLNIPMVDLEILYIRGKRGVSNRGFVAVVGDYRPAAG